MRTKRVSRTISLPPRLDEFLNRIVRSHGLGRSDLFQLALRRLMVKNYPDIWAEYQRAELAEEL